MNPIHTTPSYFCKIRFNIILPPTSRSSFRLSHQNAICITLFSIRATYPVHNILLDFIILFILGEEYELRNSCRRYRETETLYHAIISIAISLSICCFCSVSGIMYIYIYIYIYVCVCVCVVTYSGFAWLIIMGSGFDDWIYWHFFTITVNCNSSHIELFWMHCVSYLTYAAWRNSRIHEWTPFYNCERTE
jgi:hypothetical protein